MNTPTPTLTPAQTAAAAVFSGYEHPHGLRCHGETRPNHFDWFYRTEQEAAELIAVQYRPLLEQARDALLSAQPGCDAMDSEFRTDYGKPIPAALAALTRALDQGKSGEREGEK